MERGLLVHAEEERPGLDAVLAEPAGEFLGVHPRFLGEYDAVHPVDASGPRPLDGKLQSGQVAKSLPVSLCHPALVGHGGVYTLKLRDAERGLEVRQPKVAAHLLVEKAPRLSRSRDCGTSADAPRGPGSSVSTIPPSPVVISLLA